jgi:outer membrane protein OmpA-like peptidoglycan-associated protein
VLALLALVVVSCAKLPTYVTNGSLTNTEHKILRAQAALNRHGVEVIAIGDKIKIVLPTALLFNNMTINIHNNAGKILAMVIEYLNNYTMTTVTVAAYTNKTRNDKLNKILSTMQAEQIARYLQAHKLKTRFLTAVGYGGTELISGGNLSPDAKLNYRIEITTNYLA